MILFDIHGLLGELVCCFQAGCSTSQCCGACQGHSEGVGAGRGCRPLLVYRPIDGVGKRLFVLSEMILELSETD